MKIKSYRESLTLYFEYECDLKTILCLKLLNNLFYSSLNNLHSLNDFVLFSRKLNSGVVTCDISSRTKNVIYQIDLYHANTKVLKKNNVYFQEILKLLFITKKFKIDYKNFVYEKNKLIAFYKNAKMNSQRECLKSIVYSSLDIDDASLLYIDNIKVIKSIKRNDIYDILNNLDKHLFHVHDYNLDESFVNSLKDFLPYYNERKLPFKFFDVAKHNMTLKQKGKNLQNSSLSLLYKFDAKANLDYVNFINYYFENTASFIFEEIREKLGLVYSYVVYMTKHCNFVIFNFLIEEKNIKLVKNKLDAALMNIKDYLSEEKYKLIRKDYVDLLKANYKNDENLNKYNDYLFEEYFINHKEYLNKINRLTYSSFAKILKSLEFDNSLYLEGENA